jgi:hypothetical protein
MKHYYWTTKDGNKINVDDMSEEHLRNVLKLLIRRQEKSVLDYCDATIWDIY